MYKTPLTRICVTETEPPGRYLGHRPACKHSPAQWPNNRHRQHQPASKSLHLRNPSLMGYYSFNRPRSDGWLSWLSWLCWLTDSGRLTHKVVTRPAISLAQVRESSPARTGGLTTMLRHQLKGSTGFDYFKSDRSRISGGRVLGSHTNDETNGVIDAVSCYKFSAYFVTPLFASFWWNL